MMQLIKKFLKLFVLILLIISGENDLYSQSCFLCPGNSANGDKSSAGGTGSSAYGNLSFAYGNEASANGIASFSFGTNTYTSPTAINSFAFGRNSTAEDAFSFSLGYFSNAMGFRSYALGNFAQTLAGDCFAIGSYVRSLGSGSITLGCSSSGRELINPNTNNLMVGFSDMPSMVVNENSFKAVFVDNEPVFYVGPSSGTPPVMNVGIGTTDPSQLLHVNGNSLVDGHMYLIGEYSNLIFSDRLCSGTRGDFAIEYHDGGLNFWKPWKEGGGYAGNYYLFLKDDGKVGIGTSTPRANLDITGTLRVSSLVTDGEQKMIITDDQGILTQTDIPKADNLGNHIATQNINLNGFYLSGNGEDKGIFINSEGKVAIGTTYTPGNHSLYVKGGILAEEIKVQLVDSWSDYVFQPGYKKISLTELEKFINENKHLPDVPSADEMKQNGLDVVEINSLLLKKIEELTLYIIDQQKQIENLKMHYIKLKK